MSEYSGVEAADINDKDILDATKQIRTEKGYIRFEYTMADGHLIKSEEFNPEQGRKAIMAWCDTVRAVIVARAQEGSARKSRTKMVVKEDLEGHEEPTPPSRKPVKPIIEIVEPTEREEYCCAPAPKRPTVEQLQAEQHGDAEQWVEAKIEHHRRQVAKWKKVLKAIQED